MPWAGTDSLGAEVVIEQYDIEMAVRQETDTLLDGFAMFDREARLRQRFRHALAEQRMIIDQQRPNGSCVALSL